jgi:squalene-hopene/tetraprenyl-beta-curcumene cyclase
MEYENNISSILPPEKQPRGSRGDKEPTLQDCQDAVQGAREYAIACMNSDGHWSGEVQANVTITAEYVFLKTYLDLDVDHGALIKFLTSQQQSDGSWGIAPDNPGDISTSVEAYLALKILGVDPQVPMMQEACLFIHSEGGMGSIRLFTRIYLAMFGLYSWDSVPQLAPELILIPNGAPMSIYNFASWARITLVPLLVIASHRLLFALPNGRNHNNNFLDELWLNPAQRKAPYAPSFLSLLLQRDWIGLASTTADAFMLYLSRMHIPIVAFLRRHAIQKCMAWLLERQEPSGDFAGIFPSLHAAIMAMYLEGIKLDDPRMVRGLEALERFGIRDLGGLRFQSCVSAGWDTALMTTGVLDSCPKDDTDNTDIRAHIDKSLIWMRKQQNIGVSGDWRIYRPFINSGGFSFEYQNSWYPDIDDTQASVIAFVKTDPENILSEPMIAALEWILGMQSSNGGWAGFDYNNDKLYLNNIPFSDMGAFCDPPTADVTGDVLECFGLIMEMCPANYRQTTRISSLLARMEIASDDAIGFLVKQQESDGSFYGRWGCNYLYGTAHVLCGLEFFHGRNGYEDLGEVVSRGLAFLERWQNLDGGWGESAASYNRPRTTEFASCESTPSQTAWCVMGLVAYRDTSNMALSRGVKWLIDNQTDMDPPAYLTENTVRLGKYKCRSWKERLYTATGFPGHMMLKYEFYRHYFPMMALGRFVEKKRSSQHSL